MSTLSASQEDSPRDEHDLDPSPDRNPATAPTSVFDTSSTPAAASTSSRRPSLPRRPWSSTTAYRLDLVSSRAPTPSPGKRRLPAPAPLKCSFGPWAATERVLVAANVLDVEVQLREGRNYPMSSAQQFLPFANDFVKPYREPFTAAVGTPLCSAAASPAIQGSSGFFVRSSRQSKVYLITCQHVLLPHTSEGYRKLKTASQARLDVHLMDQCILAFGNNSAFSKPGDSGAVVVDIPGRIGGLLTAGSGSHAAAGRHTTYVTPIEWLMDCLQADSDFADISIVPGAQ